MNHTGHNRNEHRRWRGATALLAAALLALAGWPAAAQDAPAGDMIVVKLVTDFESARLVSEEESFEPVTETTFSSSGSKTVALGERATLWVRNAHVDKKFFFERYYQGKYIGRQGQIEIDAAELGVGEHTIEPGGHRFALAADGTLSSKDAQIRIAGKTVMLKLHRVTIYAVDGAKTGPPEFRLLATDLGLFTLPADFRLDPAALPDPRQTFNPQKPTKPAPVRRRRGGGDPPPIVRLVNTLSHQRDFYPLHIWLPSNQIGQGYLLYPSWQTFHLTPAGRLAPGGGDAPLAPGIEAVGAALVIPHRRFSGRISTNTGLNGGVGSLKLGRTMLMSTTLEPLKLVGGVETPAESFFLPVNNDFTRRPFKYFVADNRTPDPSAVRLLAAEWDQPIYQRGSEIAIGLRLLETPGKEILADASVQMHYSLYTPALPTSRTWQPVEVLGWRNDRADGVLRFRAPDIGFDFVVFRLRLIGRDQDKPEPGLQAEFQACVIEVEQRGSASFVSNKGRTAFVAGEDLNVQLVLRSNAARAAGRRTVVLRHPSGEEETLALDDPGAAWHAASVRLPAARTLAFAPGAYSLSVRDLPPGVHSLPFRFDLVGRDKSSLYHVVKPSKYTKAMNNLERGHLGSPRVEPVDLDRAMRTVAELGYNRVDLMSYMTNHHLRHYTWREDLAATDPRLPAPSSVYTPTPRNQILNACVRQQLQFADVWLTYNDFHLPRRIEGYISASERWLAREVQATRHSPAADGMMLYDEMYQIAVTGIVEAHPNIFPRIRARLAQDELGKSPSQIDSAFQRYVQRPKNQRDPEALRLMLRYRDWQQHGWGDYVGRMVKVGKELAPHYRFGTYHRTWASPGNNDTTMHGYPPDLFKDLDIISHVHYADNATGWASIPILARILRTGVGKKLWVNLPLSHEFRTRGDGQYQRHMAFALMAQGANGISQWGLPASFDDGPNPETAKGRETTRHLNREILQPFGELIDRTTDGYRQVGIVSTLNQHSLSEFKEIDVGNQTEGIWIACWRLGYQPLFLREEHMREKLEGYAVIFVPGVRFEGELDELVVQRLREAIAAGVRVVVERGSALELPGLVRLEDQAFNSFYVGTYFATWYDDELKKVYEKSQPIVDYLRPKLKEWDVQPAARGNFKVGPSWRSGGDIDYLIMANFDDPDYGHTVKQQMAKPLMLPLRVAPAHGKVAYDLLAQRELPLQPAKDAKGRPELALTLDMRRLQGAMVAFVPERIARLQASYAVSANPDRLRLRGALLGETGEAIAGVFPVRVVLGRGASARTFYRVLGPGIEVVLDLPPRGQDGYQVELREALSGRTLTFETAGTSRAGSSLEAVPPTTPLVPYPAEVSGFLEGLKRVVIIPSPKIAGVPELAQELARRLEAKGVKTSISDERSAYHLPTGDAEAEDPLMDGFHSWRRGQEIVGPPTVVDDPVILLGGKGSLFLLDGLSSYGYLSVAPVGGPGLPVRPNIQVARRGLHFGFDALCLIANDLESMKRNVEHLFAAPTAAPAPALARFGPDKTIEDGRTSAVAPAISYGGTNEMVVDLQFDQAGNTYLITWGHGKNFYSFTPDGKPRFSRFLPEMGTNQLQLAPDRALVHTSAGARVYQLTLAGEPISQARLNLDPGHTKDDDYRLAWTRFEYLPDRSLLLHNMGDRARLLDSDFEIVATWRGEEFFDKDVSDKTYRRRLRRHALSPDQKRLAQLETSFYFTKVAHMDVTVYDTHLVIRDLDGKLLHEAKNLDNGKEFAAELTWPTGAPGPIVSVKGERIVFGAELKEIAHRRYAVGDHNLGGDRRLVREGRSLAYYDSFEHVRSSLGPFEIMPTLVRQSPDAKLIATLDEYGQASLYRCRDGSVQARFQLPELGNVLRFTPDSSRLLFGSFRGALMAFDLDGKELWETRLGEFNDILGKDLPLYDPAFPDFTDKLWPRSKDEPGELDKLVRLGVDRLANGNCEGKGGWQGAVQFQPQGYRSRRSLLVGPKPVAQDVKEHLGQHVTWMLEFFYRRAAGEPGTLLAGVMAESDFPDSTAREFEAGDDWRYGRVVIKNGSNCKRLSVGFSTRSGEVLVDQAQLRRMRFPSINHMLYEPIHAAKPVILDNPLFSQKYDPIGNVREQAPNRVIIQAIINGALNLVESAFLQNGRLNEIGSNWYVQPLGFDPTVSMGMKEPHWISMVALYFNVYDEEHLTPHFDIYATDMATKKEVLVASIRHNGQLFRLVKFPPIKTPLIKVKLVNSIARQRTVSEIELYGPLSGSEGTPGFVEPDGQNTYMGDFSRVDRRQKALPPKLGPPSMPRAIHDQERNWFVPSAQILASGDRFFLSRSLGMSQAYSFEKPLAPLYETRANGLGFTPYGALYGGLLLRSGNDGRLYCLDPESGAKLWAVRLGERLFGCPVAIGEDVFAANETGTLYQLDLANGSIMRDAAVSGGVFGSLATDGTYLFLITNDGFLQKFRAADLSLAWRTPLAPYTDSTPAIDQGVVYLADQQGTAVAIAAADGKVRWRQELGDEFTRCPVVLPKHVVFGCRGGKLAVLDRATGKPVWTKQVKSRFHYEPLPLAQGLLYFDDGRGTLAILADGKESPLQYFGKTRREPELKYRDFGEGDPAVSLSFYRGSLLMAPHDDHADYRINFAWHTRGGRYAVLRPAPPPSPEPKAPAKKRRGRK